MCCLVSHLLLCIVILPLFIMPCERYESGTLIMEDVAYTFSHSHQVLLIFVNHPPYCTLAFPFHVSPQSPLPSSPPTTIFEKVLTSLSTFHLLIPYLRLRTTLA
jgi:hypothetical protein